MTFKKKLVCPYCKKNKGFNTGHGVGQLTCSNCNKTFDVDKLVELVECQGEPRDSMLHQWKNDPLFEQGIAIVITNDNPEREMSEEMRQVCENCGLARYIPK